MWALLSSRLRTWLFVVIAIPAIRAVIRRVARGATRRNPDSAVAQWSRRVDALLTRFSRRRRRH